MACLSFEFCVSYIFYAFSANETSVAGGFFGVWLTKLIKILDSSLFPYFLLLDLNCID